MEFRKTVLNQDIRALLSDKLHVDCGPVPGSTTLADGLGIDSLGLSDLAEAIEAKFEISIPNRMLPGTLTIDQLVDLLSSELEAACAPSDAVMAEAAD